MTAMEPNEGLRRVNNMTRASHDEEVAALYAATSPRLIGQLAVMAGGRHEAEDVVQEAFARLVPRWGRVRDFDDPESWVRAVAINVLISRERRARVARVGLQRLSSRADVPQDLPDADVDVHVALRALPLEQRIALVLHHALDLSVADAAEHCGVSVGTLKSRLARGRAGLARALEEKGAAHHV